MLAAIKSLGVEITPEEVQEMLAEADVDTNGKAAAKDTKSPGKVKKSSRKTLQREDDRSNLSGLLEDAMLGNVTRLLASQVGLLQPYDNSMFKVLKASDGDEKR